MRGTEDDSPGRAEKVRRAAAGKTAQDDLSLCHLLLVSSLMDRVLESMAPLPEPSGIPFH